MSRLGLFLLFLLLPLGATAQTGKLFDADKQLSSSFTMQVYMDRDGFIWVVTRNGLNRYDGYQFHIMKKEQQASMASNYINCMMQDRNGLFYMGMYGALQTYDGNLFTDVEVKDLDGNVVPCYVTCFLQRADGDVLAGTSGHGLLKLSDRSHANQLAGPLADIETVHALGEDRNGHLWIVSDSLLLEYDGKTARRHLLPTQHYGTMRSLAQDKDGNIYVGTSVAGVFVMSASESANAAGNSFRQIDLTDGKSISTIFCRRDGRVMLGYDGQGVAIYDPNTGAIEDNPYYSNEVDLHKSKVYSIVEDTRGNVWLGLLQKGIFMQPAETGGFRYMGYKLGTHNVIGQACVLSTIIDSKGRCWVGTDKDGLYCLDSEQHLLKHFPQSPSTVMSLEEDHYGRIWVGSYEEGFGYIDADLKAYHKFPLYTSVSAFSIKATRAGELWVATMGQGLLRIPINASNSPSARAYVMAEEATTDRSINCIANNYISKMSLSPDERRVYTATTMGLCCYDIEKDSWTSVFGNNCLNYGTPTRIVKEYGGRLWIGTNDGLYCYDMLKKALQLYTSDKSLATGGIASIEQDKDGRLWISTDHGLFCHDPMTETTHSYYVDNGLQSNEFSDGASWSVERVSSGSPNGEQDDGAPGNSAHRPSTVMLFGGAGGITWFHPELMEQSEWPAKVSLVSFIVNRQVVNSSSMSYGYQICDTTVIAADRFQLSHHDNTFALQFSTLTYDNPEHVTYSYSLNGEEWTRLQPGVNEITFTHVPPGSYHFRVKAERNGQPTPEREFTVVIHAPWYRTLWAFALYFLALCAAGALYVVNSRREEKNRLRLQEHIHAEEMGEAKLRFFMNISHEIRTPMTLILTPLQSLIKKETDPAKKSVFQSIHRNAERILSLINQMMDLRKIDKGMMQMRMQETDLIAFVEDIHALFDHQAHTKHISLTYRHDDEKLPVWIDRQQFDKVIVNILSNAFKFTPPGGEIVISITATPTSATITISDNGEQIPEDKLERIFERFYQTTSTVNDRNTGTGIGLDLTRSLVELHHGTISAQNLEKGCTFIVTIPLGKEHLKPEEIMDLTQSPESSVAARGQSDTSSETTVADETAALPVASKPRIVIAEDDDEIRTYLESELGSDFLVTSCTNGRDALEVTLRTMPDIIVSDVMMPEMDGNSLCATLKSNPQTSHLPVVILTAKNRDEDYLEGLETGADSYIVKPFNMDILRRTIVNLINSRRQLQLKYSRTDQLEQQLDSIEMRSPDDKLLERIMRVLNKNLSNSELSVDQIANEVGISRVHLHRKMKELTGQTPHDFIRALRLKQAAKLLAAGSMNITEVVYACGFGNVASFSTTFKKYYGMSPREYMLAHQKP